MTLGCHWLRQFSALDKIILTIIKISREVAKFEEIRVGSAMNFAFLLPPPQGERAPGIEGDIYLPIVAPKPVYGSHEQLLSGTELGWLAMDEVNINTDGSYLIGWAGLY
ncbi:hypothetical protein K7432_002619 [Basidiobolus ranarum]|uniref:Uncharacterized protein n=1 Tax=Basidiobolus ranarum TaxID=34480 RepID=A0ABR2X182_9FUNG